MFSRRPRSIRFRLTAWYAGALALVLLVLIFAASEALERRLTNNFDADLLNTARAIQSTADVGVRADGIVRITLPALDPFSVAGYFIQTAYPSGAIDFRSESLGDRELPPTDLTAGLERSRFDTVTIDGERLRIVYAPIRLVNSDQLLGVLSVAASTDQIETSIDQMRRVLGLGALLALLTSIIGGWFLAGRALKPVEQMRRDVAAIALDDPRRISLDDRVRDPGTSDEISRLAGTFNDLLDRLEAAFETERRFIADASHELRTPLTAIRGNVDVLIRQAAAIGSSPDQAEALADIQREAARMGRLVEGLLTLARTSTGDAVPPLAPIDLEEPVSQAVRTARALAPDREIVLNADAATIVAASPDQIEQVVLILLDNAVRHSHAPTPITVELSNTAAAARLSVTDQGEGIAPEHLPRLFDRFYRVDTARSRQAGGAGLGLSIARVLLERNGASIEVESTIGLGTRFTITFPKPATAPAPVR
ncbi:MAG: HAMP domain-containing protein [Thermomicrobiales bacterium]|nr:HAMP domain-containing protein [Thermomicrobiales bacterium]